MEDYPEGGGGDVGEDAEEDGGFTPRDVFERETVSDAGVVSYFDKLGTALLAAFAEVFDKGVEEALSCFVSLPCDNSGESICTKGCDITFVIPFVCQPLLQVVHSHELHAVFPPTNRVSNSPECLCHLWTADPVWPVYSLEATHTEEPTDPS